MFAVNIIDISVVTCFLIVILIVGIASGRGIKNIREYALGGRDFSTITLSATIAATWISGSFFVFGISETYSFGGIYIFINVVGNICTFLIISLTLSLDILPFKSPDNCSITL